MGRSGRLTFADCSNVKAKGLIGSTVLPMAQIVRFARARASDHTAFKKILGQVGCAKTECDGAGQHQSAPCDAKAYDNDVLGNSQLFERHGSRQQLKTPSRTVGDESSRRKTGIDRGDQN